jgi:subtilisin family serine protease
MADEGSPLLRLAPPRTLTRKKRGPAFPPAPSRNPAEHSRVLGIGLGEVRRHFDEAVARLPSFATDVPYVRIEVAPGALVSDAELSSIGLVPVYHREDAILAAYSKERSLRTFESQLASYTQLKKKLAVLAKIQTIRPWSRDDRSGTRLKATHIDPAREYTVDLLVMPVVDEKPNPQAVRSIEKFVAASAGRVVDRALEPTFSALRVRLRGQALNQMLDYRDDIALADLPPDARVIVPEALSLRIDDVPDIEGPSASAPAVCLVDSGILEGHPLLEPAIVVTKSKSFPKELGPPVPNPPVNKAGHGTCVAGVALYADVAACAHAKSFVPELRIINARMLDDKNELHPDRMPFLREIVEHVRDECRVLNLSFGLEPHEGFLSIHAVELDALARETKMLFVVSSGNVAREYLQGKSPPSDYPAFMLGPHWRVLSPAEALNVLTVGGVTPDSEPFAAKNSLKVLAPKRAPSPFGCTGGIKNVLKPELVEVAGNLGYDALTKTWVENEPGLRVVTTSPKFATGSLLGFASGTSFAAPKVAHLAARLLERYPDASPNLLRALLIQSARLPEGAIDWKRTEAMRLCGFGVPDIDRALYCRPQRATLYYEGEIVPDEVKLFEIPVPPEFAKSRGRKAIVVTLAFDPPVSAVHRDRPAGINLTWGVARGDVAQKTVETAIAAEAQRDVDDDETDAKAKSPFSSGEYPKRMQQRGTVQKNVFAWKRGVYGDTYRLAVTAKAVRPAHTDTRQNFAVVVTLECEDSAVNVFNLVRARLGAGRVRIRVPASH